MHELTATDELRRMLDERKIEHWDGDEYTLWGANREGWYDYNAHEGADGTLHVHMHNLTPEQAIAATLGVTGKVSAKVNEQAANDTDAGTCQLKPWEMERDTGFYDCMECACGYVADVADWAEWHYCPDCGRKVVAS